MALVIFALLSGVTALASLQRAGVERWSLEPYGGAVVIDDGQRNDDSTSFEDQGFEPVVGARGLVQFGAWDLGLDYGYAGFESDVSYGGGSPAGHLDVWTQSLLGVASRSWSVGRLELAPSVAAGAIIVGGEDQSFHFVTGLMPANVVSSSDLETEVDPLVAVGLAVRRDWADRLTMGGEIRDMVQFCNSPPRFSTSAAKVLCSEDATLHHVQFLASLRIDF